MLSPRHWAAEAAFLALAAGATPAQDPTPQAVPSAGTELPSVADAVQRGIELLLDLQETYVQDARVGRMADDELPAWQAKERQRLAELRAQPQSAHAEWPYEGVYRVGGLIPPGYRVGSTAIVCSALVEAPGFGEDEARQQAVARATRFMLDELEASEGLAAGPKTGYDVRGWGHTYALDFFLLALRNGLGDEEQTKELHAAVPDMMGRIAANEVRSGGGWNYAGDSCSPFMTGATLLALFRAREQGFSVEQGMIDRALDGLQASRYDTGSYAYSGIARKPTGDEGGRRRRSDRSAMAGACARAAIAELSLLIAGRSNPRDLRVAVDGFFEHWGELLKRKSKQGTHMGDYGIAPYYFFFGHTYAALAIEYLPEKDRPNLRTRLQHLLWETREENGGWNDRIFPRSEGYSTAMCLLALVAPGMEKVAVLPQPTIR